MPDLTPLAARVAEKLKERGDTIAVTESSTGGLISAALLSIPGASAYFVGGSVVYTLESRKKNTRNYPRRRRRYGTVNA